MSVLPRALLPDHAVIDADGRLSIGGVDVHELVAEFGSPLFVYDEAELRARCREAVEAFPDGVAFATKAFLCKAMARLAHEAGMDLDVASGGELYVARAAGVPAERLVLHGNNKSEQELREGGVEYVKATVPFKNVTKGRALKEEHGLAKLLVAPDGTILGAHLVGAQASTLLHEIIAVMKWRNHVSSLTDMIHIHPSLPEVIGGVAAKAARKLSVPAA